MTEEKDDFLLRQVDEGFAIGLWQELGFDPDEKLSPREMMDIISIKINSGEISPEHVKMILDSIGTEGRSPE